MSKCFFCGAKLSDYTAVLFFNSEKEEYCVRRHQDQEILADNEELVVVSPDAIDSCEQCLMEVKDSREILKEYRITAAIEESLY